MTQKDPKDHKVEYRPNKDHEKIFAVPVYHFIFYQSRLCAGATAKDRQKYCI
jgi:hypothetical protein